MIKILPIKENNVTIKPFYRLVVTLGYGEHCSDTYTESSLKIDDDKAMKYALLSDEDCEKMDLMEITELSQYIMQSDAEKLVKLFNSLVERKDIDGYQVDNIILNDGPSKFWWKQHSMMTDKEYDWFSQIYDEYSTRLFNPIVEHNWCGIVGIKIEYVDENGKRHMCEVV